MFVHHILLPIALLLGSHLTLAANWPAIKDGVGRANFIAQQGGNQIDDSLHPKPTKPLPRASTTSARHSPKTGTQHQKQTCQPRAAGSTPQPIDCDNHQPNSRRSNNAAAAADDDDFISFQIFNGDNVSGLVNASKSQPFYQILDQDSQDCLLDHPYCYFAIMNDFYALAVAGLTETSSATASFQPYSSNIFPTIYSYVFEALPTQLESAYALSTVSPTLTATWCSTGTTSFWAGYQHRMQTEPPSSTTGSSGATTTSSADSGSAVGGEASRGAASRAGISDLAKTSWEGTVLAMGMFLIGGVALLL